MGMDDNVIYLSDYIAACPGRREAAFEDFGEPDAVTDTPWGDDVCLLTHPQLGFRTTVDARPASPSGEFVTIGQAAREVLATVKKGGDGVAPPPEVARSRRGGNGVGVLNAQGVATCNS